MADQNQTFIASLFASKLRVTVGLLILAVVVALIVVCHLYAKPILAVLLFVSGPAGAVALDYFALHRWRQIPANPGASADPSAGEVTHLRLNLQIVGLGIVLGAGVAVIYIVATVALTFLEISPSNQNALWQHFGHAAVAFLTLALIVWAAVRICSVE